MTSLYILAAKYKEAQDSIENMDLDDGGLSETLESLGDDFEGKVINTAMVVQNLGASIANLADAEKQMKERRKKLEAKSERVKKYILDCMRLAGVKKVSNGVLQVSRKEICAANGCIDRLTIKI